MKGLEIQSNPSGGAAWDRWCCGGVSRGLASLPGQDDQDSAVLDLSYVIWRLRAAAARSFAFTF